MLQTLLRRKKILGENVRRERGEKMQIINSRHMFDIKIKEQCTLWKFTQVLIHT